MIKSNKFAFGAAIIIVILLIVGNWVVPVQANSKINTMSTPTGTPLTPSSGQGESVSAEQQEEIKSLIQAYFEIRYRALSTSQPYGFQLDSLGNLISGGADTKPFLDAELGKLTLQIKYAELNHSKFVSYKYFLDFSNFSMDAITGLVTVSVVENNEFVSENSAAGNPTHPHIAQMSGLKHTIVVRKEQDQWKIVSDFYNDFLWRTMRQTGESVDETLDMLNSLEATPISAGRSEGVETDASSLSLPVDPSSHDYERENAKDYAIAHAELGSFNPDYWDFSGELLGGDCTNFVSQAIYEGGNANMDILSPLPNPDVGGYGWYYLNLLQRAAAWNYVDNFYNFVTQYAFWDEGPEGYELGPVPEGQFPAGLLIGDVIQYERHGDASWDHSAIVVAFDQNNGEPLVASHSPNTPSVNFKEVVPHVKTRFIHIERSDGYLPVKAQIIQGGDNAGTITQLPNTCGYTGTLGDDDVYFGRCFGTGTNITSGFQFRNINIPQGAQVKYAYIKFTVDGPFTVPLILKIDGENTGNPVAFSSSNPPESASRQLTGISVSWNIEDTDPNDKFDTLFWDLGMRSGTPDLSPFIGSIVNGPWTYGNTLSIIVKNESPLGDPTPVRRVIGYERATSYLPAGYSPARLVAAYDLTTPFFWPPIQESDPFISFGAKDGWILESSETSGKGGSINADDPTFRVGDDSYNKQYRSILHFDTSTLPDNAVITTVELKIKQGSIFGTNPFTTHGNLILDIKKPSFGNAKLAKSDFEAFATPGGYAGAGIFNPVPSGDWYTVTLNSAAFSYINLTGTTQFRLAFTLDDNNDLDPDFVFFFSGDTLTPTNRPQLIIYYYIPPP